MSPHAALPLLCVSLYPALSRRARPDWGPAVCQMRTVELVLAPLSCITAYRDKASDIAPLEGCACFLKSWERIGGWAGRADMAFPSGITNGGVAGLPIGRLPS